MEEMLSTHITLLRLREDRVEDGSMEHNALLLVLMFSLRHWGTAASALSLMAMVSPCNCCAVLAHG